MDRREGSRGHMLPGQGTWIFLRTQQVAIGWKSEAVRSLWCCVEGETEAAETRGCTRAGGGRGGEPGASGTEPGTGSNEGGGGKGGSMRMTTGPLLGQGPRRCCLWRTECHQALVWGSLAVMPEGISSTAGDNINIHIGLRLRFWGNVSDRGSQYFLSEVASGPQLPSMSH